ncbi:hypothetical protein D9V87_01065 [Bacteroidetes/Chlorobi group bacterium MS-B_bin-24]|jgi:hypothetical protein|nr:MAG: hypothetical protein D9V87_01065 [Bacteroidetes/Chlorobi group bacterium MS-B_bin-24]
MYLRVLAFSFAFLFISVYNSFAEATITLPKKILTRGTIDTLSIYFSNDQANINSLKLTLQFNAYILDIKKVLGSDAFIITEPLPKFSLNLDTLEKAKLTIESSNLNIGNSRAILCQLLVEGLVYRDSVDTIRIVNLEVDGSPAQFVSNGGEIIAQGPSVIPIKSTYISIASPLPTSNSLWFYFGLSKTSYLEFTIFNFIGEKVYSSSRTPDLFKVLGNNSQYPVDGKFEDGDYKLTIELPPDFPSGAYFLQLNAFSIGTFSSKFLVVK